MNLPLTELNEALRKAREAMAGGAWTQYGGEVHNKQNHIIVRGLALNQTLSKIAAYIAHMNPEFTQRLLKEFLWQREMLERAKPFVNGDAEPNEYSSDRVQSEMWLTDLETGPTDHATGQEKQG